MKKKKQLYRIRNWKAYNEAPANRGSITLWFDQDAIRHWLDHSKSGKPGKPRTYGSACIQSMMLLKAVYHLPQRATYGLVCSLMQLHILVDATGLKVYGEGECKVRTHGRGNRNATGHTPQSKLFCDSRRL